MKICTKCKRALPLTAFNKDSKSKDGLKHNCKDCRQAYAQTPKQKQHHKEYAQRPEVKERRRCERRDSYKKTGFTETMKRALMKYRSTEKFRKTAREYRRKQIYLQLGITLRKYDELFEKQNGVCAICGLPEIMKRLCVDHNHRTGEVRGLLCSQCNILLGCANDNIETLEKAKEYLLQQKEKKSQVKSRNNWSVRIEFCKQCHKTKEQCQCQKRQPTNSQAQSSR